MYAATCLQTCKHATLDGCTFAFAAGFSSLLSEGEGVPLGLSRLMGLMELPASSPFLPRFVSRACVCVVVESGLAMPSTERMARSEELANIMFITVCS